MNSSPDDTMFPAASGRRLRPRTSQITYSEENSDEAEDNSTRRRLSGFKRKAEINVESLYRQENSKDATSTPLETIYELPRFIKNGKCTKEYDQSKEDNDGADLSLSVMAAKKIKRFCLFPSHYFPTKQKTRFRKERARKMKQLRGVKIPKGTAISAEELEAVLACLFVDESQNENAINVTKRFSNVTENIGFYEGNIIKPDISNAGVDDIIQNMDALRMNKSKRQKAVSSGSEDTIKTQMIFDDLISSLTDEPIQPCSPNCHEKKIRRRSGRLLACPLKPVEETLDVPLNGMQRVAEFSPLNRHYPFLRDSSVTTSLVADVKPENIPRHELGKSSVSAEGASCDIKLEQVDTKLHKVMQVKQKMVSIKDRQKDNIFYSEPPTEQRAAAKERTKQRKPQSEQGKEIKKVKRLEMGIKRSSKSHVDNQMKKQRDCKDYDTMELYRENVSELKCSSINIILETLPPNNVFDTDLLNSSGSAASKHHKGCKEQRKSRSRGKRRVSGIQKPLYRTILQPASPDTLISDTSNKSLDQLDGAVERKLTNESEPCMRQNIITSTSPTVPPSGNMVVCCSPASPSAGMAALTLNTDKPSTLSTAKISHSPITRLNRKTNSKARRRSSRLSMDFVASEGLQNNSESGFGSYWSAFSPFTTRPVANFDKNTLPKGNEKSNIITRPSSIFSCETPCREKESTNIFIDKRGTNTKEIKSRRRSRVLCRVDLEVVDKSEASAKMGTTSSGADHLAAGTSSVEEFVRDNSVNIVSLRAQSPQISSQFDNSYSVKEHEQLLAVSSQSTRIANPPLQNLSYATTQTIAVASVHDNLQRFQKLASYALPNCVNVQDLPGGDTMKAGKPRDSSVINPQYKSSSLVSATHSDSPITSISSQSHRTQEYLATPCTYQAHSDDKQSLAASVSNIKSSSSGCVLAANSIDDVAWDSPIISGMFENKAGIRQGKVFCNKDAPSSSPITHL